MIYDRHELEVHTFQEEGEEEGRMGKGKIIVFDPTGMKKRKLSVGANRLSGLQGKHLAVIWNGKLGGDIFLDRVSELLTERFSVASVVRIDDRGDQAATGVNLAVIDRLAATCDAIILGTGD